jgi:DNA-binding Lrp family transcriptional regulator
MSASWITIRQAAEMCGLSRSQTLRRLERRNSENGGKLLRWAGAPGGRREVNVHVLRQILRADPREVERDLAEVHERIDVLDGRTNALVRITRKHEKAINQTNAALEALRQLSEASANVARVFAGQKS